MRRLLDLLARRGSLAFDVAVAFAAAVMSLGLLAGLRADDDVDPWRRGAAIALVLVHTLTLALRRRAPWTVLAVNLTSGLAVMLLGFPSVVLHVAPVVAVYTAASRAPLRASVVAQIAGVAGVVVAYLLASPQADASTLLGNVVVVTAAWLFGTFVRERQDYVERLERRTAELQEARDELARAAVTEERLRIARELHDVVAHGLGVIAVQSGVGAHVIDARPDEAKRALAAIEDASRVALEDMRRVLGVLREGTTGTAPAPGLDGLEALVARVSSARRPTVRLMVEGEVRPLPPGLELTAYRIVQEALTNVVKHADADEALVTVRYRPTSLEVEVTDDGVGDRRNGTRSGHGLDGMRERVALFDGALETGEGPVGGFRVRAQLPVPA